MARTTPERIDTLPGNGVFVSSYEGLPWPRTPLRAERSGAAVFLDAPDHVIRLSRW